MKWLLGVLVVMLLPLAALAIPVDPPLQQELIGIFDKFNASFAAGDYDKAMALRSAKTQERAKAELKTAQDRKDFAEMVKMTTPDSLEVVHSILSRDGDRATLIALAKKTVPAGMKDGPPPGSVQQAELTLDFVKEGGSWKYDNQTFGMDPAQIKACTETANEPETAYDLDSDLDVGGPIRRVEFAADYTMVVVRVVDEENCAFLPNKQTLQKAGFDTGLLTPYTVVSIKGFRHKTSKQKVLVDTIDIDSED